MGFREWADKNQKQTAGIAGALVVIAAVAVVYQVLANRQHYPTDIPNAYFTVDEGKTYFVDKSNRIPPFDHDGQTAVRAYVFSTAKGTKFVGLLERYSAATMKDLAAGKPLTAEMNKFGREVKVPGAAKWTPTGNPKIESAAEQIKVPDGSDPTLLVAIDP